MALRPLGDRVIIKADDKEEKTASGIILTESAQEKPLQGEVVSVGRGSFQNGVLVEMEVKAGDKVIYGKYSGSEITVDSDEYIIMKESDLLAII